LRFGDQKLNLDERGGEIAPHAAVPTSGSADLCFIVADPQGLRLARSALHDHSSDPLALLPRWDGELHV
jgi:hypothetical protein